MSDSRWPQPAVDAAAQWVWSKAFSSSSFAQESHCRPSEAASLSRLHSPLGCYCRSCVIPRCDACFYYSDSQRSAASSPLPQGAIMHGFSGEQGPSQAVTGVHCLWSGLDSEMLHYCCCYSILSHLDSWKTIPSTCCLGLDHLIHPFIPLHWFLHSDLIEHESTKKCCNLSVLM